MVRRRGRRGPQPPARLLAFDPVCWPAGSVRGAFDLWHEARSAWATAYPGSGVLGDELDRIRGDYEHLYAWEDSHGGPPPGARSRGPRIQRVKGMR